jgi:hypothetical protein
MKRTILISTLLLFVTQSNANQHVPNPILVFTGKETIETGGKQFTRYYYEVTNREDYAKDMFVPAPNLPPCGNNKNASRTWVEIYQQNGQRLNGFCAITNYDDLKNLWFALETDVVPPSWIYIEMVDRSNQARYKSNLTETTL